MAYVERKRWAAEKCTLKYKIIKSWNRLREMQKKKMGECS